LSSPYLVDWSVGVGIEGFIHILAILIPGRLEWWRRDRTSHPHPGHPPYLVDWSGGVGIEGLIHILDQKSGLNPGNVSIVVVDDVQRGVVGITESDN
jgi:hypothetical protein